MQPDLQPAFRALADPTRRDILRMLGQNRMSIGQVADRFEMTRAAVRKHMRVLEEGNLIRFETHGRERLSSLNAEALRPVTDWLSWFDRFWDDKLSALQSTLAEDSSAPDEKDRT